MADPLKTMPHQQSLVLTTLYKAISAWPKKGDPHNQYITQSSLAIALNG